MSQRKFWKVNKKVETIELNQQYEYEDVQRTADVKFPHLNMSIKMMTPGINPMSRSNFYKYVTHFNGTAQCHDVSSRRMHLRPLQSLKELHFVSDIFVNVGLDRWLWNVTGMLKVIQNSEHILTVCSDNVLLFQLFPYSLYTLPKVNSTQGKLSDGHYSTKKSHQP